MELPGTRERRELKYAAALNSCAQIITAQGDRYGMDDSQKSFELLGSIPIG